MSALLCSFRSCPAALKGLFSHLNPVAVVVLCALSAHAFAQTTTISGTVYDPRTTASALPLPNVLVYATTGAVAPLPSGVQCLTYAAPTGVTAYTFTGVDGSFTLKNVPVNQAYTLVIQAGKWRRKFSLGNSTLSSGTLRASKRMSSAKKSGKTAKRLGHSTLSVAASDSACNSMK